MMTLTLASGEFTRTFPSLLSVNVCLRNGSAQILPKHQDLIGKVENNILELEVENEPDKTKMFLQDGIFLVSNEDSKTSIYVFSKRILEIEKGVNSRTKIEELKKELEQKSKEIETKQALNNPSMAARIVILQDEIEFIKKYLKVVEV